MRKIGRLHYTWLSITTYIAYFNNEKKNCNKKAGNDPEVTYPLYIERVSWIIFGLKVLGMIIAAVILLSQVIDITSDVSETDNKGFYLL